MKLKAKFSFIACLVICLSCFMNDKAEVSLYSDVKDPIEAFFNDSDSRTDHQFRHDCFSFSAPETQCRVPRQTNVINPTRTVSQAKRSGSSDFSRHGFTLSKSGKSMNQYTTSLFFVSINRFPSGLAETGHHLIHLGKLII